MINDPPVTVEPFNSHPDRSGWFMNGVRDMGNTYAAKLTFSETVKGIPNDKENTILCQTLVFYQYKDGLFAT